MQEAPVDKRREDDPVIGKQVAVTPRLFRIAIPGPEFDGPVVAGGPEPFFQKPAKVPGIAEDDGIVEDDGGDF